MKSDYAIRTEYILPKLQIGLCSLTVPSWVNENVVKSILLRPEFSDDIPPAYSRFREITDKYSRMIMEMTETASIGIAPEYLPMSASVFMLSYGYDFLLRLPKGLSVVPAYSPGKGLETDLEYISSCYIEELPPENRGECDKIISLKESGLPSVTGKGSMERKKYREEMQELFALGYLLFPGKFSRFHCQPISTGENTDLPFVTGRLCHISSEKVELGLFSPLGQGGNIAQAMHDEAQSISERFFSALAETERKIRELTAECFSAYSEKEKNNADISE